MFLYGGGSPSSLKITRSLRFNPADTTYLSRTLAAGTQTKFTFSAWVKRTGVSASAHVISSGDGDGTDEAMIRFLATDELEFANITASSFTAQVKTVAKFKDTTAWMHIVVAIDTTDATGSNRVKMWVNGASQSLTFTTTPAQNSLMEMNCAKIHQIGRLYYSPGGSYFDGLMAEISFVDGTALTAASFGKTDTTTGVWVPKRYGGSYGSNGFSLSFTDNSAATSGTIGKDRVGSNDFTPVGVSVALGSGNDSLTDSPSVYADGKNGRGNYCVMSALAKHASVVVDDGGLRTQAATTWQGIFGTIGVTSGKWYWEVIQDSGNANHFIGISNAASDVASFSPTSSRGWYGNAAQLYADNAVTATCVGGAETSGQVIQFALDLDNARLFVGRDNTWYSSSGAATGDPSGGTNASFSSIPTSLPWFPYAAHSSAATGIRRWNFGQQSHDATNIFKYAPPTGFKALCTANMPTPTVIRPSTRFEVASHTGSGSSQSIITAGAFQVDAAIIKSSSAAEDWVLVDRNRSSNLPLNFNSTAAEGAAITGVTLNSNGITVPANTAKVSTTSAAYVDYLFSEGVTPGFDLAHYTGDNTANKLFSHSLGVIPHFAIVKSRSTSDWFVYHRSLSSAAHFLRINDNGSAETSTNSPWGTGSWTATQFMVTNNATFNANAAANYAALLWTEIIGFSRFGGYTGSGSSDGPFVWCGFRPKLVIIRGRSTGTSWRFYDSQRDPANENLITLLSHSSAAQTTEAAGIDLLASGFKVRWSDLVINGSGSSYIFAAFAEVPFKSALAF